MKPLITILFLLLTFNANCREIAGSAFIDRNLNGIKEKGEKPFKGLQISNGRDIVLTDNSGNYSIESIEGRGVFAIKPSGYQFELDKDFQPRFYHTGNSGEFNIPLRPSQKEDKFSFVLLGDPQVYAYDQVYHLAQVATEELLPADFDFMITLGDLVGNTLPLLPVVKETLGLTGRPCYYVIGNHDRDRGRFPDPTIRDNVSFEQTYGPSYYSFNMGDVHFLVLNNILTRNPDKAMRSDYVPGIHPVQAEFIKNDLSHVPAEKLIIVCAHIPFFNADKKAGQTKQLISFLQDHPRVFIATAHAHNQIQLYLDEKDGWKNEIPVHQLVAGTICGGWWRGEPDIFGIPGSMMRDGTPRGYWFMHVDGTSYQMEYKVSGMSPQKQMHIWVPQYNEVDTLMNPPDEQRDIWINVYAGNEVTDVKLRIDSGHWRSIERKEAFDPYILRLLKRQEIGRAPSAGSMPLKVGARASTHLWHSEIPENLPKGVHVIEVKAKNEYGLDANDFRLFWKN